ncbi:unnamed protein product, partial [Prorocentrum cordatum]
MQPVVWSNGGKGARGWPQLPASAPIDGSKWTCSGCGTGGNWAVCTSCRACGKARPKAEGGQGGLGGQSADAKLHSLTAKLKTFEAENKSLTAKVEQLLRKKKQLETELDCSEGAMAAALAEIESKLEAARAARDKAKPTSAQLREANSEAEKAAKAVVAADELARKCQEALQEASAGKQEALQADAAARAHAIEVRARTATDAKEAEPRAAANDVDVLKVQAEQLRRQLGASEFDLPACFTKLAARLEEAERKPPDATEQPDKYKRYLELQQQAFANLCHELGFGVSPWRVAVVAVVQGLQEVDLVPSRVGTQLRPPGGRAMEHWTGFAAVLQDPRRRPMLRRSARARGNNKCGDLEIWTFNGSGWGTPRTRLPEGAATKQCCSALQETNLRGDALATVQRSLAGERWRLAPASAVATQAGCQEVGHCGWRGHCGAEAHRPGARGGRLLVGYSPPAAGRGRAAVAWVAMGGVASVSSWTGEGLGGRHERLLRHVPGRLHRTGLPRVLGGDFQQ